MTRHNKAVPKQGDRHHMDDGSRPGLGVFAVIAILTVLGIAVWLIVNSDD